MDFVVMSKKRKGLHSDLIVFLCQALGEDQRKKKVFNSGFDRLAKIKNKKKVFTQVLIIFFCQKASEHTHEKKGHFDGFCGILQKANT